VIFLVWGLEKKQKIFILLQPLRDRLSHFFCKPHDELMEFIHHPSLGNNKFLTPSMDLLHAFHTHREVGSREASSHYQQYEYGYICELHTDRPSNQEGPQESKKEHHIP
jgi:hypothetical protein